MRQENQRSYQILPQEQGNTKGIEMTASSTNERGLLKWPTTQLDEQLPTVTTDVAELAVLVDQTEYVRANNRKPKRVKAKQGNESQYS